MTRQSLRMYQVDAFTDRLFAGNPAAVLILAEWLPDALMGAIAQENNLAETAFACPRADGTWDLRWFTPVHEVAFCGHATLATAHVLFSRHGARGPLVFHTRVGALQVAQAQAGYVLDLPRLDPAPLERLPEAIAGQFAAPRAMFRNFENIFVDLGSADAVRGFVPDMAAIARLGQEGLAITGRTGPGERADFVSRYFVPGAGIPEDPVTGSIHATLVPYWAGQMGRDRVTAYQASARGGWLDCTLQAERVLLAGQAVTYMEASLFVADMPREPARH